MLQLTREQIELITEQLEKALHDNFNSFIFSKMDKGDLIYSCYSKDAIPNKIKVEISEINCEQLELSVYLLENKEWAILSKV